MYFWEVYLYIFFILYVYKNGSLDSTFIIYSENIIFFLALW